jgi:lipoprotein-anchoring transpeptidase ErfK/SrfK
MPDVQLNILLPRNRNYNGVLRVEIDGTPVREFSVLGRGSRGAGDTTFMENGNTPTGEYDGSTYLATAGQKAAAYGPWGKVVLKPIRGTALLAQEIFGRKELRIHGGELGDWYGTGGPLKHDQLRPTHGCLRLSNPDMATLYQLLQSAGIDFVQSVCVQPNVRVTVREF